jgi:hypothetical protein
MLIVRLPDNMSYLIRRKGSGQAEHVDSPNALVLIAVWILAVIFTSSGTASAAVLPSTGDHAFTPQAPGWTFGDANGSGSEQISYGNGTEQWGYRLSPAVQSLTVGAASEIADLYCGDRLVTRYGAHLVEPSYYFHGSAANIGIGCQYHSLISISFKTANGEGNLTAIGTGRSPTCNVKRRPELVLQRDSLNARVNRR